MARLILLGRIEEAVPYVPQALHVLNRMKQDGLTTGSRATTLEEGVFVRVVLDPMAGDKVYLKVEPCPMVMFDGFIDSSTVPISARAITAPGALQAHAQLPVTDDFLRLYEKFLPSKFTGIMRQVVQCSIQRLAENAINAVDYHGWNTASIGVNYKFGDCYGVVKNNSVTSSKDRYSLVRVTRDKIYRVPAKFCVSIMRLNGVDTDVVQLISTDAANAVQIGAIPNGYGQPWSDEIGWAFSYTKPEASIVLTSNIMQGKTAYPATALAVIQFGFSSQTGVLTTAVIALVSPPAIFWNDKATEMEGDYGLLNVPEFGIVVPELQPRLYHSSIDFGRKRPFGAGAREKPPGYRADGIPIYVHYTHGGDRKVYTYTFDGDNNTPTYYFDEGGENFFRQRFPIRKHGTTLLRIDFSPNSNFTFGLGSDTAPKYAVVDGSVSDKDAVARDTAMRSAATFFVTTDVHWSFYDATTLSSGGGLAALNFSADAAGHVAGLPVPAGFIENVCSYSAADVSTVFVTLDENQDRAVYNSSLTLPLADREACVIYTKTEKYSFDRTSGNFSSSASVSESMYLMGSHSRKKVEFGPFTVNGLILNIHPYPQDLSFKSTQAAFNPENEAHSVGPGLHGGAVVSIKGTVYAVGNTLFGWIGVV